MKSTTIQSLHPTNDRFASSRRIGPLPQYLTLFALLLLFALALLWPIARILRVGFFGLPGEGPGTFTLAYFRDIFLDPVLRGGLLNSTLIAVSVTLLCTLISVPLALLANRYQFRGKALVNGLLLVPLILPPFVGAIGMRQILGRFGVLTAAAHDIGIIGANTPVNWFGSTRLLAVIIVEALSLYPIIFLNVSAALANLDPAMEQAAANLGASRWTIFRRITLPLMRPGLFAGATIVLIWSFTEVGTPLMFDVYQATPVQVFERLTQVHGSPLPYALVVVMLLASALLYIIGKLVLGRRNPAAVSKASIQSTTRDLSFGKGLLVLAPFLIVIGLALLPHIGVILTSVSGVGSWYQSVLPKVFTATHYTTALTHELAMPSVRNSVLLASASTVIDVGLGLLIAWLIVRSRLPAKGLIDSLAMLPLAVPGLVLAFGYLAISLQMQVWFKDIRWLRNLVDAQENPVVLLIIAYAMRRLPYVVRSAVAGLNKRPLIWNWPRKT